VGEECGGGDVNGVYFEGRPMEEDAFVHIDTSAKDRTKKKSTFIHEHAFPHNWRSFCEGGHAGGVLLSRLHITLAVRGAGMSRKVLHTVPADEFEGVRCVQNQGLILVFLKTNRSTNIGFLSTLPASALLQPPPHPSP
jgi:hypothetical protein